MLDIGWPELFVIALVALVVIGPKDLPRVMRYLGRWFGKAKRVTWEFRRHWDDIMRESELDDVRREIEAVARTDPAAYAEQSIDPNREIREAFEFRGEELVNVQMPQLPPAGASPVFEGPPPDSRDYGVTAPVAAPAKDAVTAAPPGAAPAGADKDRQP
jgi:sec-independent protein translocase protein TatB